MIPIDIDELIHLYVDLERSIIEIGEELGVCPGTVYNRLKKNGIKIRKTMRPEKRKRVSDAVSKALKGAKRPPFSEEHKRKISQAKKGKCRVFTRYGGHKKHRANGYVLIYCPNHPNATKDGYVAEHTLVMEAQIGDYLPKGYVVHHKNHIRNDNRIENLELMTSKEHSKLHLVERRNNGNLRQHTVGVMNVETGELFDSVKSAAEKYNTIPTHVSRACKFQNRTANGFHWKHI